MADRTRINVTGDDGTLAGWFILESAKRFLEDYEYVNGFNKLSANTRSEHAHQTLYRTAKGQWVLADWSDYQDSVTQYRFVGDEEAKRWLVLNLEDAAVEKYFGEMEEEAGPNLGGRPTIGPKVEVRLPQETLDRITAYRGSRDQADALREVIAAGLDAVEASA